jgi:hypothetical protein
LTRVLLRHDDGVIKEVNLTRGIGGAIFSRSSIEAILAALALPATSPLSVVFVETLPELGQFDDPLGGDLGNVRILRTSPLTAVPPIC